jgi:hypothetical protein
MDRATGISPSKPKWTTMNPPPEGHEDVAVFAWELFEAAKNEKMRLQVAERWKENYRLYRGSHWLDSPATRDRKSKVTVNLFFANVQRTVANITARNPVCEVVSLDGNMGDDADKILTTKLQKWYHETEQQKNLAKTALNMENYGITIEKAVWNSHANRPEIVIIDPYAFFPAPGNYGDAEELPYFCHAQPMSIEEIEKYFGVEGVGTDNVYSLLGEDREDDTPSPAGTRYYSSNYPGNYSNITHPTPKDMNYRERRGLVVEVWIRDYSKTKEMQTQINPDGTTVEIEVEKYKYPGGIRTITVTNHGGLLLDDKPNPNVNPRMLVELSSKTYLWDHWPLYFTNSYEDNTSLWGFGAAEQVGDLNYKINEIVSRIASYINRVCLPPLIVPLDTGISKQMINNRAGLVLRPASSMAAQQIRYMQVPNLPGNFMDLLQFYLSSFDRVYQIEDADRGQAPRGVIAASAIVALQERNAVLIRQKIRAVDFLVRQRGRCAISLLQSFGTKQEFVDHQGEPIPFVGVDFAGRQFNYVVESGSTMPRTNMQLVQDAKELFQLGAIDRQALLEAVQFPGWKQIIERIGEGQLNQALQVLIQAGLDQETAMELRNYLMEPQGGPGGGLGAPGAPSKPGIPKGTQGTTSQEMGA